MKPQRWSIRAVGNSVIFTHPRKPKAVGFLRGGGYVLRFGAGFGEAVKVALQTVRAPDGYRIAVTGQDVVLFIYGWSTPNFEVERHPDGRIEFSAAGSKWPGFFAELAQIEGGPFDVGVLKVAKPVPLADALAWATETLPELTWTTRRDGEPYCGIEASVGDVQIILIAMDDGRIRVHFWRSLSETKATMKRAEVRAWLASRVPAVFA